MTTPEIAYDEAEAHDAFSRAQSTIQGHRAEIPNHDPAGIEDPAISEAARRHTDNTKANIDDSDESLNKGKRATTDLATKDKASADKARSIDPSGVSALKQALARPSAAANPFSAAPAPQSAPMPAPAMPAMSAPQTPTMPAGYVNMAPQALARLIDGANLDGPTTSAPGGRAGGPQVFGDLKAKQMSNARAIVNEGLRLGMSKQAMQIALMTGLTETQLRNLANEAVPASLSIPNDGIGKDHDSVGIFQQRQTWGSTGDLMDPVISANKFYSALMKVDGWQSMSLAEAAQAVQRSAFPSAYAKYEQQAGQLLHVLLAEST